MIPAFWQSRNIQRNNYISICSDNLKFYGRNTINLEFEIKNSHGLAWNSLIKINEEEMLVGGFTKVQLINVISRNITKEIYCSTKSIDGLLLVNNEFLYTGDREGNVKIFDYKNSKVIKSFPKAHDEGIFGFLLLPNGDVISYGKGTFFVVWKNK